MSKSGTQSTLLIGYTASNKHDDAGRNNMQNWAYNGRMLQGSGSVRVKLHVRI